MVNEIKLDKPIVPASPLQPAPAAKLLTSESTREEDVTVTNHLGKLINLLGKDDTASDESARVASTRHLIESGQYQVDVNTLSEKLLNSGLLTSGD